MKRVTFLKKADPYSVGDVADLDDAAADAYIAKGTAELTPAAEAPSTHGLREREKARSDAQAERSQDEADAISKRSERGARITTAAPAETPRTRRKTAAEKADTEWDDLEKKGKK